MTVVVGVTDSDTAASSAPKSREINAGRQTPLAAFGHTAPVVFIERVRMNSRTLTLLLASIALTVFDEVAANSAVGRAKNEWIQKKNVLQSKKFQQHPSENPKRRGDTSDRRVIPWVSVAVLLNFLFFFRSVAAPFFDPLVRVFHAGVANL